MTMQYVNAKLHETDKRNYTYHNDGEPVSIGDQVKVLTRDGEMVAIVTGLTNEQPKFETKPIIGVYEGDSTSAPIDDDLPAPSGHNQGPALNPDIIAELKEKISDVADAAGEWADAGEIKTETSAGKIKDFIDGCRKLYTDIEARRKTEKEPFLAGGREVDTAFNDLKDLVKRSADKAKPLLEKYLQDKEDREIAEREAEAEAARKKEAEAEVERLAAEKRNDVVGEKAAEEKAAEAKVEAKEADKPKSAKVESATGGSSKRTSLKTNRWVEIISANQAMLHYREHPEMSALLIRLGNEELRHSKGADITLPGFEIKSERKL